MLDYTIFPKILKKQHPYFSLILDPPWYQIMFKYLSKNFTLIGNIIFQSYQMTTHCPGQLRTQIPGSNYWNPKSGFVNEYLSPMTKCPHPLFGTTYQLGDLYGETYPILYTNDDGENVGISINIMEIFAMKMNFKISGIGYHTFRNPDQVFLVNFHIKLLNCLRVLKKATMNKYHQSSF